LNIPVFCELSSTNSPPLATLLPLTDACLAHRSCARGGTGEFLVVSPQAACCPQDKGKRCKRKGGVDVSVGPAFEVL